MTTAQLATTAPREISTSDRSGALPLSTRDLVQRSRTIQEVMQTIMKEDIHYGIIPGTQKPTLYQPGAETLRVTFHLAADLEVEDLSTPVDEYRYRVTARIRHIPSSAIVATGVGEASTAEEKYRWRAAVCEEEWEATPDDRKREKWKKGGGNKPAYSVKQVRTEHADLANTALKMAAKRAEVAGTRSAVGASDIFAQDLEHLVRTGIELGIDDDAGASTPATEETNSAKKGSPKTDTGKARSQTKGDEKRRNKGPSDDVATLLKKASDRWHNRGTVSEAQKKRMFAIAYEAGWKSEDVVRFLEEQFGVEPEGMPWGDPYDAVVGIFESFAPDEIEDAPREREPGEDDEPTAGETRGPDF